MRKLALAVAASAVLSGCLPVSVLRTPEPVDGSSVSVGLSGVVSTGGGGGVLPYLAFARGDGETEFNVSAQLGVRAGVKQRLEPGLSLDAGLTLPYVLFVPETVGIPVVVDVGLLAGLEAFYLSPRVQWVGFSVDGQAVSGWVYQLTGGYAFSTYVLELSYLGSFQGGGGLFSLSAAMRL
ncbi:hypothetical protein [Calidithermus chliarophilus]|uniref:hypothetical protein n=1 Tax=Calidithermus chliarophilus TaxID=52023 RepID=UPI0004055CDC|nr:hypothetical protein [Calidithermus chliarophilus]